MTTKIKSRVSRKNDTAQTAGACAVLYPNLTDAPGLLRALFNEDIRPSLRWLRNQTANRSIPFRRVGGRVFFDTVEVKEFFESKKVVVR